MITPRTKNFANTEVQKKKKHQYKYLTKKNNSFSVTQAPNQAGRNIYLLLKQLIVLEKKAEQSAKVNHRQNLRSRGKGKPGNIYGKGNQSQNAERIDNTHLNSNENGKPSRTDTDNNRHKSS